MRYQEVISLAIDHFKSCNLDSNFIIINVPGRSAYNRLERRMAKLSNDIAGVVLPHDNYGYHLDNSDATIDEELEKKISAFVCMTLAEIWNKMVIDRCPVDAEYVSEDGVREMLVDVTAEWYSIHVQESQYFSQVVN